ncbi:MAG: cofactor-independent phosphoglycerate mutase [Candidatus Omnitrophota bacterium]
MKYILLVGDGMADRPIEELGGRTVLEAAETPYMDKIAATGKIGLVKTVPESMVPASDVANLSILGYDPHKYYSGRGPLEAANMGLELKDSQVAFRCNTVTIADGKMADYSAGHIKTNESSLLIKDVDRALSNESIRFYPGISYRHLMILDAGSKEKAEAFCRIKCAPPHDFVGKKITPRFPKGKGAKLLIELMEKSRAVLEAHDINKVRIDLGENPANMIWLWGQGVKPGMPTFRERYGIGGAVISAVDLVNGLGKYMGLEIVKVPGVTGYYDTNFRGKGEYALAALDDKDFVYVHVEAPDEAGHNGDLRAKITAVENFDKLVVGTILDGLEGRHDFRIMLLPDHATPVSVRSHTEEPVPFAVCGKDIVPDNAQVFSERAAQTTGFNVTNGWKLMNYLVLLEKAD